MTRSDLLHFIPGLSSCTLDQITTWIVQPSLLRKYRLRQRGRWCLEHSPLQLLVKSLSSADRLLWNVTPDTEQRVLSTPSVRRGLVSWLEAKEGLRSCKEVRRTQRNVKTVKLVRLGAGGGVPTLLVRAIELLPVVECTHQYWSCLSVHCHHPHTGPARGVGERSHR